MVTIATVLKSGGDYTPDHVYRIAEMVSYQIKLPVHLVCLTDCHPPIKTFNQVQLSFKALTHNYPTWFSKLELFRADLFDPEQLVFYMDLDTVIVNSFTNIFNYQGDFAVLRDPYRGQNNAKAVGSGLMLLRPACFNWILKEAEEMNRVYGSAWHQKFPRGDQEFLEYVFQKRGYWPNFLQDLYPNYFKSYKAECCIDSHANGGKHFRGIPDGCKIIYFHGNPRPWEFNYLDQVSNTNQLNFYQ